MLERKQAGIGENLSMSKASSHHLCLHPIDDGDKEFSFNKLLPDHAGEGASWFIGENLSMEEEEEADRVGGG